MGRTPDPETSVVRDTTVEGSAAKRSATIVPKWPWCAADKRAAPQCPPFNSKVLTGSSGRLHGSIVPPQEGTRLWGAKSPMEFMRHGRKRADLAPDGDRCSYRSLHLFHRGRGR